MKLPIANSHPIQEAFQHAVPTHSLDELIFPQGYVTLWPSFLYPLSPAARIPPSLT